jgi:hypothetical protein
MAVMTFEAGKTDGLFIRFSLKLPLGWFLTLRVLLGL